MKTIIVGAGISGLATAHALLEKYPALDILVLEASDRPGGKVWTEKTSEGYVCESGVNAFMNNKPKTLELISKLGLSPLTSFDASRRRFIYSQQRLRELPGSPPAFLTSNVLSITGRLRVLLDIIISKGTVQDETLESFAVRRLGREAYERLIDPMASGVFAGNAEELSLQSCFPRIHEVEQEFRSLIIGLIKLQMQARKSGKEAPTAGPGGILTSFPSGMSSLTDAIAAHLGNRLQLNTPVVSLSKENNRFVCHLSDGRNEEADRVILASPAYIQAQILRELIPDISLQLDPIPYPALSVCCFGYKREKIKHKLNGFGFLVPSKEGKKILGTLWDASVFQNRAPEGHVLLRTMVGGARHPDVANYSQDKLNETVQSELQQIMGIKADPDFIKVYQHRKSIPQYIVGHAQRLDIIEQSLTKFPELILTGNAYKGVSLNDCVLNAHTIAESFTLK